MTKTADGIENRATAARRYYHPWQKDYATFLKTSEETGGEYTLIEVEVAPGGGNAPHYHKTYHECFEVLKGASEVLVGEETRTLRPGQEAVARKNTLHRFRNTTEEPTTFLVELRPGHGGFEKALEVAYELASEGRTFSDGTPKNPYHVAVLLEWSEMRVSGVFALRGAFVPAAGQTGQAQGDRQGAGGEVLPVRGKAGPET